MQYLTTGTGLDRSFFLGIAHTIYLQHSSGRLIGDNTYYGDIITHPTSGELATTNDTWANLPSGYQQYLVEDTQMILDGWILPESEGV
ncbi:MAG: hypothetical protein NTV01_00455 [Bacteroidia bacterium]|nr:hypothetical protein [Bacteroidia bacterium]